ncbi:MAG: putative toxin-antitoxin system toxin component, PIN family [Bacteroidetes bacterium]|nr:putative toxin-antitoxin system toxin component, PIN family [Bacteroidota bacterium]
MLRIVLDTNVLVASISRKSPFRWIWQSFLQDKYELCVTTDILVEYAEIIERYFSPTDAEQVLAKMMMHKNIVQIVRYFEWDVLHNDPDDNKFFDCAVAANADYIVSEDKHFDILKQRSFPAVAAIKTTEFKRILDTISKS